mgnify:CR=1 FL=1
MGSRNGESKTGPCGGEPALLILSADAVGTPVILGRPVTVVRLVIDGPNLVVLSYAGGSSLPPPPPSCAVFARLGPRPNRCWRWLSCGVGWKRLDRSYERPMLLSQVSRHDWPSWRPVRQVRHLPCFTIPFCLSGALILMFLFVFRAGQETELVELRWEVVLVT